MPASTSPVSDWGIAVITSFTAALAMFLGAIPKILGFLAILIVGWFIAGALAGLLAKLLRAARFNELAGRSGFAGFVHNMGVTTDASGMIATAANWFVRLIFLVVAFDALGLPAVSQVLQQLLLWLPNLVVALVVLVIGGVAANALYGVIRGATAQAGLSNPDLLANVARIAVWAFAIIVAVNQIGVATTLVNTLFMGFVAALALALGLSFGLGGRDTAADIVRGWYANSQRAAPKLAEATSAAADRLQASPSHQEPARITSIDEGRAPAPILEERHDPSLPRVAEPRQDPTRPRMMEAGQQSASEAGQHGQASEVPLAEPPEEHIGELPPVEPGGGRQTHAA